jgi:hypothetical protein
MLEGKQFLGYKRWHRKYLPGVECISSPWGMEYCSSGGDTRGGTRGRSWAMLPAPCPALGRGICGPRPVAPPDGGGARPPAGYRVTQYTQYSVATYSVSRKVE